MSATTVDYLPALFYEKTINMEDVMKRYADCNDNEDSLGVLHDKMRRECMATVFCFNLL